MSTYPIAPKTRRIYSKCHEYEGGWKPETESPAGVRDIADGHTTISIPEMVAAMGSVMPVFDLDSFRDFNSPLDQYDYHWAKSEKCQMVNNPRLRRYVEHRLLFDYKLSEKPASWVCSTCYTELMKHLSRNT